MRRNRSFKLPSVLASVLVLFLAVAGSGFSAEVSLTLRNGDRITGALVAETTNSVTISPAWAPQLTIPVSEIITRENKTAPGTLAKASSQKPAGLEKPPPPVKPRSWHGKIDVGTDLGFSQNTRQLYYGKAKVVYAREVQPGEQATWVNRLRNTFDYQVTYGKTDGLLSANRMDGRSKTDFDLTKRFFIYNLGGLGYDEIRRIDYQYEVGPGVGYRLLMRSNFVMNAELGMNYQVQNFQDDVRQDRFSVRLAEDSLWTITRKLSLDQKLEFFPSVENSRFFRVRFESNLRYSIWQNISLSLSVLDSYDASPAEGVSNNDLQIRSTVGIGF